MKKSTYKWTVQFEPMLFKGQLRVREGERQRERHTERDLLFLYIHRFFYEELAHIIMEAEKSKICSRQAGDPGESIT